MSASSSSRRRRGARTPDWSRLVTQAQYFAAFHEQVLLPWFSELEARHLPGQFAVNHLRLCSGVGLLVRLCDCVVP